MDFRAVRGHFKDVHGSLEFNPENPRNSSVEVKIDARNIWTGVKDRDDHLRSADFLDLEHQPEISFKGSQVEIKGEHGYAVVGFVSLFLRRKKTVPGVDSFRKSDTLAPFSKAAPSRKIL